jgi:hypothetical protein
MYLPEFLLKRFDTLFDGNDVLNDASVIHFQIFIGPCEYISILLEQLHEGMFLYLEHQVPKLINLGCSRVPRFTKACIMVELFIFGFIVVLNLDCKSKIFSSDSTFLGM